MRLTSYLQKVRPLTDIKIRILNLIVILTIIKLK